MRKRGVWCVVLGGGRGRGSCALLERSLLAADSGGTVPVRTEVALALHSLLLYLRTFFISFSPSFRIISFVFSFIYLKEGGGALGGWSILLFPHYVFYI